MPDPLAPIVDSVFGGLFSTIDPLGMVLRTLMTLLSDALAQLVAGAYVGLFDVTTVDLSTKAVGNIWRITTGLSAALATVLLVVAAFRGMLAQSSRHVAQALPGVVAAILGPQAAAVLLPLMAVGLTDLAKTIVQTATPDLAESIRLLAGVGSNPIYEGLGLLAPIIATLMLFGLGTVFVVLLFCMAGAVVLFVLSPFAFAGLVMGPTRAWFTRWATAMFAVLFAKVPIAILLALSVSLFADSRYTGTTQSFVNAAAGMILGVGALMSPLLGYGLFSFMGAVAARPAAVPGSAARTVGRGYYGIQMGKAGVNGARSVVGRLNTRTATPTATTGSGGSDDSASGGVGREPHEPSATERAAGRPVGSAADGPAARRPSPGASPAGAAPGRIAGPGRAAATSAGPAASQGASTAGGSSAGTAGTAAAAGAPTGGVGAAAVLGAAAVKKTAGTAKASVTSTAEGLADTGHTPAGRSPVGRGGAFGSPDDHRVDPERADHDGDTR